jgi:hypothetical protein
MEVARGTVRLRSNTVMPEKADAITKEVVFALSCQANPE